MDLYFFDVSDDRGSHPDDFGCSFNDAEEMRRQAQGLLCDLASERSFDGNPFSISCAVRNEAGEVILRGEVVYRELRSGI